MSKVDVFTVKFGDEHGNGHNFERGAPAEVREACIHNLVAGKPGQECHRTWPDTLSCRCSLCPLQCQAALFRQSPPLTPDQTPTYRRSPRRGRGHRVLAFVQRPMVVTTSVKPEPIQPRGNASFHTSCFKLDAPLLLARSRRRLLGTNYTHSQCMQYTMQ